MLVRDANVTTGMVMEVACLPTGRVVDAVVQSSGLTSGRRVRKRWELGVVTAGSMRVNAPSTNHILATKGALGHKEDDLLLRAETHESAHGWLSLDGFEGLADIGLALDKLATESEGVNTRPSKRSGGGTPGERPAYTTNNPGRPNRPRTNHLIARSKGPDDKVRSIPPVDGPRARTASNISKEGANQETALSVSGDPFPKAPTSGIGTKGTTPPGSSTPASRIDTAAALDTQAELLTNAKAAFPQRTTDDVAGRNIRGSARMEAHTGVAELPNAARTKWQERPRTQNIASNSDRGIGCKEADGGTTSLAKCGQTDCGLVERGNAVHE